MTEQHRRLLTDQRHAMDAHSSIDDTAIPARRVNAGFGILPVRETRGFRSRRGRTQRGITLV